MREIAKLKFKLPRTIQKKTIEKKREPCLKEG